MGVASFLLVLLSSAALTLPGAVGEESGQCRYEFVVPKMGESCVGVAGGVASMSPAQLLQQLSEELAKWRAEHEAETEKLGTRLDSVATATEGFDEHVERIGDRVLTMEASLAPSSDRSRRSVGLLTLGQVEAELTDAFNSVTKDVDDLMATFMADSQSAATSQAATNFRIGQNAARAASLHQEVTALEQQLAAMQPMGSGFYPGSGATGISGTAPVDVTQVTSQLNSVSSTLQTKKQAGEKRFADLDADMTSLMTKASVNEGRQQQHEAFYTSSLNNITAWTSRLQTLQQAIKQMENSMSTKISNLNRTTEVVGKRLPRLQQNFGPVSVGVMDVISKVFTEHQQSSDLQRDINDLLRNISGITTKFATHNQKLTSLSRDVARLRGQPVIPPVPAPYPTPSVVQHHVPTPGG